MLARLHRHGEVDAHHQLGVRAFGSDQVDVIRGDLLLPERLSG
jgi:hypothetical protein